MKVEVTVNFKEKFRLIKPIVVIKVRIIIVVVVVFNTSKESA